MAKETKNSSNDTTKVGVSAPKETDFERRAKNYQAEVELLQRKFSIVQRAIITPFGPDVQLLDATQVGSPQPTIAK